MTNEEKARKLAIESTRDIDDNGNEVYNCLVEAALQEMAAWKEKQMIDKAIDWIKYYNENGGCEFDEWEDVFRREIVEE